MKKHLTILTLIIGVSSTFALAQDQKPPGDGPRPPRDGGPGGPRPLPPIIAALDLNKDGVIDADEIAKASDSLKTLDKNGDGKLTPDELHPPRPDGDRGPGGQGGPDGKGKKKDKQDKQ